VIRLLIASAWMKILLFLHSVVETGICCKWMHTADANILLWGVEIQSRLCVKSQYWDLIDTTHKLQNLLQSQVTVSFCSNTEIVQLFK